ncbi:peptidase domain-containing ABC transporter [Prochlorothrix hollandica]|nr:peptidase domain-containing ABC transporter [Prochlorothrix hollandica]
MTYTRPSLQDFLSNTLPFQHLPPNLRDSLVEQGRLVRYGVGDSILGDESLPYYVWVVLEGRIRLLGLDPLTQKNFTLQLLGPGEMLGWPGLLRRSACEIAIASEPSICLILPAQTFLNLYQDHPPFAAHFQETVAAAELCSLLRPQVQQHSRSGLNLKQLVTELLTQAQVRYLPPDAVPLPVLDPACTWFVSSIPSNGRPLPDAPLDLQHPDTLDHLRQGLTAPLRLVGIANFWMDPQLPDVIESPVPIAIDSLPILSPPEVQQLPSSSDPYVHNLQPRSNRTYPHVQGRGTLDGTLACFQMVAEYLEVRFRREPLRRVLQDQLNRTGSLTLVLCGQVAEMMGIKAQLVKVPGEVLPRVQTPALVSWDDGFAVLYEANKHELVLGVPELGIIRRKPQDFLKTWGSEGEVLLLQATRSTPQQKFGLQWFWPIIQRYKGVLALVFIASLFIQLFGLANPLIIQVIIDRVIVKNSTDTLQVLGFFLVVVALFEAVLTYLRGYLFSDTTNRIDMALGSAIIDHLLRLPLNYFDRRPVGELSSRVNELEGIRQFLTGTALTVVLDAVSSVIYVVVMMLYSPKLTAASLATIPLFVLLTAIFAPIIQRQLRTKAERNAQTQSHLVEVVSGIQTVKAQNVELRARWRWQELYGKYVSAGFKTVQTATFSSAASGFLNKLSGLIVLWYGAYLVLNDELTLGQLIAFRIIAGYVTGPVLRLAQVWQNFQETALSLERLSDIVDTPQESTEEERNNIPMPLIQGHVQYENVSFRFNNQGAPSLANVSLEILPGTFVGVVGQSGSGKSTLVKLLARLYAPETGRIFIDQYDITKVELYSLRRQVGIVPQDSLLFDGTVEENIALASPNATVEEIVEAARLAVAHDFIMGLPAGYNSRVGEKGSALSGGQRQRIAIARTVLQNPQMLIMDEATSALDYETERQVFENLMGWFSDRTVFFITHRLSTVRRAHQVLMMDNGSIVETGTHDELMAQRGRYYCLYQQQDAVI